MRSQNYVVLATQSGRTQTASENLSRPSSKLRSATPGTFLTNWLRPSYDRTLGCVYAASNRIQSNAVQVHVAISRPPMLVASRMRGCPAAGTKSPRPKWQEWPRQTGPQIGLDIVSATEKATRRCGEVVRAAEAIRTRTLMGCVISRHVTLARIVSLSSSACSCSSGTR
jgi:hypothetical protein